jgi:hypothetical protein
VFTSGVEVTLTKVSLPVVPIMKSAGSLTSIVFKALTVIAAVALLVS